MQGGGGEAMQDVSHSPPHTRASHQPFPDSDLQPFTLMSWHSAVK